MTRWECLARNLEKVPGMAVENDFHRHDAEGWEFVATVKGGGKRRQNPKAPCSPRCTRTSSAATSGRRLHPAEESDPAKAEMIPKSKRALGG
jgi:hypothetical protein